MRILKIELQNINSLKSDHPIEIDFEGDKFKDVGLYAITGSTGAGKTTLLDAITIALYHAVPRFKKSNVRAGLEDVVSHGAGEALSRITFENGEERFEAQWNMRKVGKNGKPIKPKEEVRFKNLTQEKILAEKKTDVRAEVERVTQLNYDQFLRSVMLAQGDFASFLSAASKDKATLLEQITGEDIYKKIGDAINLRKGEEDKKLALINSEINNLDLLTTEQEAELNLEKKDVLDQKTLLDKELISTEKIISWFKTNKELQLTKERLTLEVEQLNQSKKEKESLLLLFENHKKAEPYKELLMSLNRNEEDTRVKKEQLLVLEKELSVLLPQIKESKENKEKHLVIQKETEERFSDWLPRLDQVSSIDTEITHLKQTCKQTKDKVAEIFQQKNAIDSSLEVIGKQIESKKATLNEFQNYFEEFSNIPFIEKEFGAWNRDLTLRKKNRETLEVGHIWGQNKKDELTQIKSKIKEFDEKIEEEEQRLTTFKKEVGEVEKQIKLNSFDGLLAQKEELSEKKTLYSKFQGFAQNFKEKTELNERLENSIKQFEEDEKELQKILKKLIRQLEKAEDRLKDAKKILELEKKVQSFEEERKKLEKGEPCSLCGSTDHPFVSHYDQLELSVSENKVKERETEVIELKEQEREIEVKLTQVKTNLESANKQTLELGSQLQKLKSESLLLEVDVTLDEHDKIDQVLKEIEISLSKVSSKLVEAQSLQEKKNQLDELLQQQKDKVGNFITEKVRLEESEKRTGLEIAEKEEELEELLVQTKELEQELTTSFGKFDKPIPSVERTETVLEKVQNKISEFNQKSKELEELKNAISQLELTHKNDLTNLDEKKAVSNDLQKELMLKEEQVNGLLEKREVILPSGITVEEKRAELQLSKDQAKVNLDVITEVLNQLLTAEITNKKEQKTKEEELINLDNQYKDEFSRFEKQLVTGDFTSKQEIEKVLLGLDEVKRIEAIKLEINNKTVELEALESKVRQDIELQEQQKDFEMDESEVSTVYLAQKTEQEKKTKRLGEIDQKFELNNQIKERNKTVVQRIKTQEQELKKWTDLIKLIGGSKDAFNTYVQRLTLQNLIHLANKHLFNLNNRYSLKMKENYKTGEELNFNIIDHYQMDEVRYIDTSSGGEKFLISLSLALGLSDLASHNVQIDSLFIDEGFGTLDQNTLESVISTLETLQSQGKTIGVISHVESLKERISTQVWVQKKQNGVSKVEVIG